MELVKPDLDRIGREDGGRIGTKQHASVMYTVPAT